jgi:transposase-like protein
MDDETRAEALVYAAYNTDQEAARKYGVTMRTLLNWRKELVKNQALSDFFQLKRKAFNRVTSLADTLNSSVDFLNRACSEMSPADPLAVQTVIQAAQMLFKAQAMNRILDARLRETETTPTED